MEPTLESLRGEGWDGALGGDSGYQLCQVAQAWKLRGKVHQAGDVRGDARPEIDVAEGVSADRPDTSFVVMREEFSFIGGEVDADRTIAFAAFAGEAEVEGFFYFFAAPAVGDDFALRHLPEQMSAAPSGVFLFERGSVAGAHDAAFGVAALANTDAAESGFGEAAVIGGEFESSFGLPRRIVGAEAKIFVELVGLD